jgi:release factor glutamine methyltransferase
MKNSKEIFRDLQQQITLKEDRDEIQSMLYVILETLFGLSRAEIMAGKSFPMTESLNQKLAEIIQRVNNHEPIQYILGETYFYGRKFNVTADVLIPRPETELLVEEVLKEIDPFTPGNILDIGTGSGCIAITLAKELPEKNIHAIDVSDAALKVARENAVRLNAPVEFQKLNALTDDFPVKALQVIVSNPPYIADSEKAAMKNNVVKYEPHLALFVPDQDPFIFYSIIAEKGYPVLETGGKVLVEINERFGKEVCEIFKAHHFTDVRIVQDLQKKDRIVVATKI